MNHEQQSMAIESVYADVAMDLYESTPNFLHPSLAERAFC